LSSIEGITGVNNTEQIEYNSQPKNDTGSSVDFSSVLVEAMKDEMTRATVTAGANTTGMMNGYMPMQMQSQGIEEMILAAASTGEVDDAQIALFMLCMMMQNNQDGDFSMLMQMMASMITKMEDKSDTLRSSLMSSEYDPYVLDTIDWNVFGTNMPNLSGMGGPILPLEFWRPVTPAISSSEANRSPLIYNAVISQFRVETAERYRPYRDGNTYCNIYMWDVTRAMGAEIPHYVDPETGEPRYYPDVKGSRSLTAVAIDNWLKTYGEEYGWHQVDAETAQRYANEGKPAVTTGGSIDHVQVVCPSKDGLYDPIRGVTVSQAGGTVTRYDYISSIYSANAINNYVCYFVHD